MRPLRLHMKGFGAFRDATDVDLADVDLVALVGPTGSGKSTIIDAITFALYGSIARYDDNRIVAPIINQTSTEARVRLEFDVDGVAHVAVRVVRRTAKGATTREARLERDDTTLAADARSMTAAVEALLGLDVDQFNRTVVLPQGRFADFLHDEPGRRQATLRQLLGLEIYARVGQAARARASRLGTEADVLREQLASGADGLTADRRAELSARIDALTTARGDYEAARDALAELTRRQVEARAAVTTADERARLLAGLSVPAGVAELDTATEAATAAERTAAERFAAARGARQAARAAVDAGPDRAAAESHLARHAGLDTARADQAQRADELARCRAAAETAAATAEQVRAHQAELDAAAAAAAEAAAHARHAAEARPEIAQLDAWLALHAERDAQRDAVARAEAELAAAAPQAAAADAAVAGAEADVAELEAAVVGLTERVGIAAYAAHLSVGDQCPLCLQPVASLPDHHVDADLADARARRDAAAAALVERRAERDARRHDLLAAEARLVAVRDALARCEHQLVGVAPADELRTTRETVAGLVAAAAVATDAAATADRAARTHRDDAANRRALAAEQAATTALATAGALAEAAGAQVAQLEHELAGAPSRAECEELVAAAASLALDLREAEQAEAAAEHDHTAARAELDTVRGRAAAARAELAAARDRVAALGPPGLGDVAVGAGWAALLAWCDERRATLATEGAAARAALDELDDALAASTRSARARLRDALGTEPPDVPFDRLGEHLAEQASRADDALARFDADRDRLAALAARIAALDEQVAVASLLGHHLRADGFEGWLMRAALHELTERATDRLLELSGGQYSLVLDDRTFMVRDHANADELRSARTLSGGETFLASLSLALALADATAELAPEGAPRIESIFLDEGFGSLDPATLDTVAAAIEELGAGGRMVGIVTHIRDLADRMPVRLEVTKAGGGSTIERVET